MTDTPTRVAVVPITATGHVKPLLAITAQLATRHAGAVVRAFGPSTLAPEFARVGAAFTEVGSVEAVDRAEPSPVLALAYKSFVRPLVDMPGYIAAIAAFQPDVVLYDVFSIAGYVAGHHLGVPLATCVPMAGYGALGDGFVTTYRDPHPLLADANGRYRDEYGVDVLGSGHLPVLFPSRDLSLVTALASVAEPLDEAHHPQLHRLLRDVLPKTRAVGPCLADEPDPDPGFPFDIVALARAARRKIVLFSLGTVLTEFRYDSPVGGATTGGAFLRAMLDRLVAAFGDETRYLVVVATGAVLPPEQAPAWPGNFLACRHVPQAALLKRYVDVFITHHGLNSTAESIQSGVPMVSVPGAGDQIPNARTAIAQGVATGPWDLSDPYGTCSASALRRAVDKVLDDPSYRSACAAVQAEVARAGGAKEAARLVLALAGRSGS